jgi:protein arginine kinase activator
MSVVCQICKIRPASIHYTEIVNNKMVSFNLCAECAEEKGIDTTESSAEGEVGAYGLGDLVAGLIDSTVDVESEKIGRLRCPSCGYEYSDFKKVGRFGCPDCYDAFEAQLVPLLRQIHGNTRHAGSKPPDVAARAARRRRVSDLQESLERAVEAEDYERAAELRDEIQAIRRGGVGADADKRED